MKVTTARTDDIMSILDDADLEEQIKHRDGVVRVHANFFERYGDHRERGHARRSE